MKKRFIFTEALGAIRANFTRSALTVVGIVVGIFSVTAMLSLGDGVSNSITDTFASLGSSDLSVQGQLTKTDYEWAKNQAYIDKIYAGNAINGKILLINDIEYNPVINAVYGDFKAMKNLELVNGSVFDFEDINYAENELIVDADFMSSINENDQSVSVGDVVTLDSKKYTISAISDMASPFGRGDGNVYIPYGNMTQHFSNNSFFRDFNLQLKDTSSLDLVSNEILAALNLRRSLARDSTDEVTVISSASLIETTEEISTLLNMFLVIVGAIALFVGGIGTMNMMLTTVSERTKEIGLRKAIGAHNKDILLQILMESALITFVGGIIGIILSFLVISVANRFIPEDMGITLVMSASTLGISVLVSVLVGIIFGYYPAKGAAKLQPVDALRSE